MATSLLDENPKSRVFSVWLYHGLWEEMCFEKSFFGTKKLTVSQGVKRGSFVEVMQHCAAVGMGELQIPISPVL